MFIIFTALIGPGIPQACALTLTLKNEVFIFSFHFVELGIEYWFYASISLCGGIIHLLYVLYQDSRILKHKNQASVNCEAGPAASTFIDVNTTSNEKSRLISELNRDFIKAIGVQKVFTNGFKALYDLTFGVEKGQIFCLLGPDGAGKTTTFNILTQRISFTSGILKINSQDILTSDDSLHRIGICCQSNALWKFMTVRQHLCIYSYIKGIRQEDIEENIEYLLHVLQLKEHENKSVSSLSGGTKRKLCVGIAVLGAPDIILLDEPTTGVDPFGRNQIWRLLKTIQKNKPTAILLSTHYIEDAELIADKLGKKSVLVLTEI